MLPQTARPGEWWQKWLILPLVRVLLSCRFEWICASILLRWVDAVLKGEGGFLRLTQELERIPADRIASPQDGEVRHLAKKVQAAAAFLHFDAVCLHQYCVLCWLLRLRRVDAELVIGVYTHPFTSHAWVACYNEVLHWKSGMGSSADWTRLQAMAVIFRTGRRQK